jgi:ribosome maturation protein Sdo1
VNHREIAKEVVWEGTEPTTKEERSKQQEETLFVATVPKCTTPLVTEGSVK